MEGRTGEDEERGEGISKKKDEERENLRPRGHGQRRRWKGEREREIPFEFLKVGMLERVPGPHGVCVSHSQEICEEKKFLGSSSKKILRWYFFLGF